MIFIRDAQLRLQVDVEQIDELALRHSFTEGVEARRALQQLTVIPQSGTGDSQPSHIVNGIAGSADSVAGAPLSSLNEDNGFRGRAPGRHGVRGLH